MKKLLAGLLLVASTALSTNAMAIEMVDGSNPDQILSIARGFGSATMSSDKGGDPRINGRIDGTSYMILFYGCSNNKKCSEIQFNAYWSGKKVTLEALNKWNHEKKFGKAFLDDDKDPFLQMTVNLDKGVSYGNLEDTFDYWTRVLSSFQKTVIKD